MPLFRFLFVFALCFASFLAGWLSAIFVPPGNFTAREQSRRAEDMEALNPWPGAQKESLGEKPGQEPALSFFEELRDNIFILFDPYKMDSFIRKSSSLEKESSYIGKSRRPAPQPLKAPPPSSGKEIIPPAKPVQELSPQGTALLPAQTAPKTKTQKIQEEHDKINRSRLAKIAGEQNFFKMDGKFSFLADVFSEREEALARARVLRDKYPLWSFLIKIHPDHTRVYLGPFPSKRKAMEFKRAAPQPPPFSMDFLEEVSL